MITTLKYFIVIIFLTMIAHQASAQQEKGYYYFGWAYSFELERMIITPVKYANCKEYGLTAINASIGLQFHGFIKAEYKQYFKYKIEKATRTSRKNAETYRRKIMGDWNYSFIKTNDFTYFCD